MSYKKPTKNQKTDKQAKLIECVLPFCFWNYGEIYRPLADNFAGWYVSRRISGGFQLQEIIHTQEPRRAGHTTKKTELDDLREALCQRGKPRKLPSEWRITTRLLQFAVRKAEKWTKIVLRRTPVPDCLSLYLVNTCLSSQTASGGESRGVLGKGLVLLFALVKVVSPLRVVAG